MLCDFTPASPAETFVGYLLFNRLTAAYPILCGALCLAGALGYLIAPQKMT